MPTSQFSIKPSDLASFSEEADGNLKVALQRFGRLTITLPNSPLTIEVAVRREKGSFACFVTTDVDGDEKTVAAAAKKAGGARPTATYQLCLNGSLEMVETQPKKVRDETSGKGAAEAPVEEPPGSEGEAEAEDENKI